MKDIFSLLDQFNNHVGCAGEEICADLFSLTAVNELSNLRIERELICNLLTDFFS